MSVYTEDRRVAFVHIPKCAGWSIKKWLADNMDGLVVPAGTQAASFDGVTVRDDMPIGHLRLADWQNYTGIDPAEFDSVIAVVRNPYEHALSQWTFWRAQWKANTDALADPMVQQNTAIQYARFADFLADPRWQYHARYNYHDYRPPMYLGDDAPGYADYGGYYKYWLEVGGEIPDNVKVITINKLDADLPAVLGVDDAIPLEHWNTVPRAYALGEHYTPDAVRVVEREYAWAFSEFYDKGGFTYAQNVARKRYQSIGLSEMPDDPAQVAVDSGYVGAHAPASARKVGVWRWRGIQEHRDRILEIVKGADSVIDMGGASGPLGYGSTVVDPEGELTSLYDIEGQVDCVFTSHTLEHLRDVDLALGNIAAKVRPGGHLIAFVPSCKWETHRAENWPHHHQTFYLGCREDGDNDAWVALDEAIEDHGFAVELAEYAEPEDNNIIVIARRVGAELEVAA